jgi:2-oxoglutarate ferredoxin oxidoreductase subunit gamma
MTTNLFMAGFGGQGVLLAGNLLAYAAIDMGLNACFFPAYGVEKRGGTANCTLVISAETIGSPVIGNPEALLAFNPQSMAQFFPKLKKGGDCIVNSSLIKSFEPREDVELLLLPAVDIALAVGDARLVNMVMLGAYLGRHPLIPLDCVKKALEKVLPERNHRYLPMNYRALDAGAVFSPA